LVIDLSLQGSSPKSILIHRMDIEVVKRRPALRGPHYQLQGGGLAPSRLISIDLDARRPKAVPEIGPNSTVPNESPGPVNFPFFVSEEELEHFVIIATAERYDCEWKATIHWTVAGKQGSTELSNQGKPYRLTGTSAATSKKLYNE
jgi:hypothetical protein